MPINKAKFGLTEGSTTNAQIVPTGGPVSGKPTGPDAYDGRANTNAGEVPTRTYDFDDPARIIESD